MKKISTLLSLASLLAIAVAAHANTSEEQLVVRLENFSVRADRYNDAEKSVEQSLAQFRAETGRLTPRTTLPALSPVAAAARKNSDGQQVAAKPAQLPAVRS